MQINKDSCKPNKKRPFFKKMSQVSFVAQIILIAIVGVIASCLFWYNVQLSPVNSKDNADKINIKIESGATPGKIADELKASNVIRSSTAFKIYLRLSGKTNLLKAGTYRISPTNSTGKVIKQLVEGKSEAFSITFFPGATLTDNTDKPESKKQDVTTMLRRAGYSDIEISDAFSASYGSPLFAGKPANADLEGYVFGETYRFNEGVSVKEILQRTFDEFYSKIEQNDLITKYNGRKLSLYEGITLASIIQREVNSETDRKNVAQVFYNRLGLGMNLGSDVTYQYVADKLGVERDTNLNSPYNTRLYGGLPPGPISSPGISALLAVAEPTPNDYLFFLSGDDNVTYFATNEQGHQINISSHCLVNCSIP